MTAPKKKVELHRLERFKGFIDDFPIGQVQPCEEPDFIVHAADRIVGVELTELYREPMPGQMPQQASEAMRHKVVERAKVIYDSRGLPPVMASFFLNDRIHIKKSEVEPFAELLANLVSDNFPAPDSGLMIPDSWQDARRLPNILHKLTIRRLDVVKKSVLKNSNSRFKRTWGDRLRQQFA
jgi:hypothetical protein